MAISPDKIKIKQLPSKLNLDDTDLIIVEDSEDTKQSTTRSLRNFLDCDSRYNNLKDEVIKKINDNSTLDTTRYNELNASDVNLNKRCDDIKTDIGKLQEADITINGSISALSNKVTTNTSNITAVASRTTNLEIDNTANKNKITIIEGNIKTITNNVTALTNDNITNKGKLDDLYNLHQEVVDQIKALGTDLTSDLREKVEQLDLQIKKAYDDLLSIIDFYHHHEGAQHEAIEAIYKIGGMFITIDEESNPEQLFPDTQWASRGRIQTFIESENVYMDLYMWSRIK